MPPLRRMTVAEVLQVRDLMSRMDIATCDSFGQVAPLDINKLESAVHRQSTGSGGKYKYNNIPDVAATLFYGIVMSHAFENGNKRTGVVSLLVFLDMNKFLIVDTNEDDIYELARSVASHDIDIGHAERTVDLEVEAVSKWIHSRGRSKLLGDKKIRFKVLRSILEDFGCVFEHPDKNYIKIRRGSRSVTIGYPRADWDVAVKEVKKIRRHLHLAELDGVDSSGFYDFHGRVDSFVNKYRTLLRRLADL